MQDGYTQSGAGPSDMRVAGQDLQHARQTRTADELHVPVRMVRQSSQQGGPMKEYMQYELQQHLASEKNRHEQAKEHVEKHLERHHSRHYDSQYGHDAYKHDYK